MENNKIAVVMGSDSDMDVMKPALDILARFGVPYEVRILSAHRTPIAAHQFAENAKNAGFAVIIAAAGMAAHLAGVMAAGSVIPVVGVPIQSGALSGLDALLSTAQMPPGIPVATMGINGSKNAALFAVSILALSDARLADELIKFRSEMGESVVQKDYLISKEYSRYD